MSSGPTQTACASSGKMTICSSKLPQLKLKDILCPGFHKGGPPAAEWFMGRRQEVPKGKILVWGHWQEFKERGNFATMSHAFPSDSSLLSFQSVYTELIAGFCIHELLLLSFLCTSWSFGLKYLLWTSSSIVMRPSFNLSNGSFSTALAENRRGATNRIWWL